MCKKFIAFISVEFLLIAKGKWKELHMCWWLLDQPYISFLVKIPSEHSSIKQMDWNVDLLSGGLKGYQA